MLLLLRDVVDMWNRSRLQTVIVVDRHRIPAEPAEEPLPVPPVGGGLTYAQGPHVRYGIFLWARAGVEINYDGCCLLFCKVPPKMSP